MITLAQSYAEISERVRTLNPRAVLVAVSKGQPAEKVAELYRLGQRDFGENYLQELLGKQRRLVDCPDIRWHFIGHLQTNKVKTLLPAIHAIHSVDSVRLAREISRRAAVPIPVFLEINIDGEARKSGVAVAEASEVASAVAGLPNLSWQGLMCVPAAQGDRAASFARLKDLRDSLPLGPGLSMGMSDDYAEALAAGATHVRIGSALFGAREL